MTTWNTEEVIIEVFHSSIFLPTMNFKEIADAWIRAANPTVNEMEIAEQRYSVCAACPEYKKLVGLLPYCAKCLCPIDKKIFANSKESCPLKKWAV